MSRSASLLATVLLCAAAPAALAGPLGIGRPAHPAEIAAWDIDVRPDGHGLPAGRGSVAQGEEIYAARCASCHGDFAEGLDRWPVLAGGEGTLASENPVKTIGSYWPFATTVFDYVRRAMPFDDAQSLSQDELYAVTAYLLHMNDLLAADGELDAASLAAIRMPNRDNFIDDPRPDTPAGPPCENDCKKEVHVTGRAGRLDVTPTDDRAPAAKVE